MDVKELRRLLRLMRDFDLTELEIEEEGHRVRLRRGAEGVVTAAPVAAPAPAPAPAPTEAAAPAVRDIAAEGLVEITSPMVGTFYRSPSPDEDPFVQVGDAVGAETVVCIIEAMKVMNEIKAEVEGEILQVLVENGEMVEYGQVLMLVRP